MATYCSKGDRLIDNTVPPKALGTVAGGNAGSGLSSFWSDCPLAAAQIDPAVGYGIQDDFTNVGLIGTITTIISAAGLPGWLCFGDAGATIAPDALVGGGLALTNDATDDDQVSIAGKSQPFRVEAAQGDLWYEARVKVNSTTTEVAGFVAGLMGVTAQTTIVPMVSNTGILANIDFIGFNKVNANTTSLNSVYKNIGGSEAAVTAGAVLVAGTYINLGFKFKDGTLKFYQNGTLTSTLSAATVALAAFPNNVTLRPVFAVMNGTAAASILTVDWIKCFQTR
jgi:hypothetical protein